MSESKHRKNHKQKLEKFKNKQKMSNNNQQEQTLPKVRQVPIWKSQETIEMNGLEFQQIFNFINSVEGAYAACQSIMNKNILKGTVQIDFEKLNEDQSAYVPMTDEEKAPHTKEVNDTLNNLKAQSAKMVRREDLHLEPKSQENVPVLEEEFGVLVDMNGNKIES